MNHSGSTSTNTCRDVDDGTRLLWNEKCFGRLPRHVKSTIEIVVDDRIPAFVVKILGQHGELSSCIIHQNIQAACLALYKLHQCFYLFAFADVACKGETTADGLFTLKEVECLAACGWGACFQIREKYYMHLNNPKVEEIIEELSK